MRTKFIKNHCCFIQLIFLDTYCGNSYYNISSDSQLVNVSSDSVSCFDCILPGQNTTDDWQVNSNNADLDITAEGLLIVANSSELFGGLTMAPRLTCGNREYNMSMTALITYTGKRNIHIKWMLDHYQKLIFRVVYFESLS